MTLMHSFRTGLASVRQKSARWGRSGGGLPRRVAALRLAAAAAAASAAEGAPGVVGVAGVAGVAGLAITATVGAVGPFAGRSSAIVPVPATSNKRTGERHEENAAALPQ